MDIVETLETCFRDDKVIDEEELKSLLYLFRNHMPGDLIHDDGRCLQLDLRGKDFLSAVVFFQTEDRSRNHKIFLKGYNFDFATYKDLEAELNLQLSSRPSSFEWARKVFPRMRPKFAWAEFPEGPYIMMVFYSKPLVALALKANGVADPDKATIEDCSSLDFQHIRAVIKKHVSSFIRVPGLNLIPEIAHSGLGLGYNLETGAAVNPLDGATITDPEVRFESRVNRAMIEVYEELREQHSYLYFSSCTRLCEVRTPEKEFVADMKTGKLKVKPDGEKGISTKMRSMHGGFYPQSDLVVADDPWAEIAARTWIDEYARLNRRELLEKPYWEWLAQAGEEVVTAVKRLNGPSLPNTVEGPIELED